VTSTSVGPETAKDTLALPPSLMAFGREEKRTSPRASEPPSVRIIRQRTLHRFMFRAFTAVGLKKSLSYRRQHSRPAIGNQVAQVYNAWEDAVGQVLNLPGLAS
jgi:hypothetical protein